LLAGAIAAKDHTVLLKIFKIYRWGNLLAYYGRVNGLFLAIENILILIIIL